jgi:hypothetical protein
MPWIMASLYDTIPVRAYSSACQLKEMVIPPNFILAKLLKVFSMSFSMKLRHLKCSRELKKGFSDADSKFATF